MAITKWKEAVGGLVRYRERFDRDGYFASVDVDYYARGIGWTSYDAAKSSWTAAEQREVRAFRRGLSVVL